MSKVLRNDTASPITFPVAGVTIEANTSYAIPASEYMLWAGIDELFTHIGNGDIVVNDGTSDLGISDAIDLIKGSFPTVIGTSALQTSGYYPDPTSYRGNDGRIQVDSDNNLQARAEVHTDAGSLREGFPGSSLKTTLTGTLSVTNDSDVVTGSGTAFQSEVAHKRVIKLSAHGDEYFARVMSVDSDTQLTLFSPYQGPTGSGTGQVSNWQELAVNGASVTVGSGKCTLTSGSTNGGKAQIVRFVDYCPLSLFAPITLSHRRLNQNAVFGFLNDDESQGAYVLFDGVNKNLIKFVTMSGSGVSGTETTTVVLTNTSGTSSELTYQVDVTPKVCALSIDGIRVASHLKHTPAPYENLNVVARVENTGTASGSTTMDIHAVFVNNADVVQVVNTFTGAPQQVEVLGQEIPVRSGIADGELLAASTSAQIVLGTSYTEQSSEGQRSIISTSLFDTLLGNGARTVEIKYYNAAMQGPFYETVQLNGLLAVNTVATDICYVESMRVVTAGSLGLAQGIIELKTGLAGLGTTIGSIALGKTRTHWCHHYVPAGMTAKITALTVSGNGGAAGKGVTFCIRAKSYSVANAVSEVVVPKHFCPGGVQPSTRLLGTPVEVQGPARIMGVVEPESNSTYTTWLSFTYYEV